MTREGAFEVTAEVRAALLRKYRLLARWRRAKDLSFEAPGDASEVAAPAAMRALAAEFPGALRELDLLGLAELERRIACLDREASELGRNKWIAWIGTYHALMRLALALRGPTPPAPPPLAAAHILRDVHQPPGGRLSAAVLQALARLFQQPADEIRAVLFPPRR